jgi:hypothetical protein
MARQTRDRSALGWRAHSGWAVLVAVRGPASSPLILTRERIDLVDDSLPKQPYHAIIGDELSLHDGSALIARVRRSAIRAAAAATKAAVKQFGVSDVGVVARVRNIPDDLERILSSHALLHAAEGALFEQSLLDAATRAGLACSVMEPNGTQVGDALDAAGKALGPPWQKDHKLAATAAMLALER